jgi:hypothetical protein
MLTGTPSQIEWAIEILPRVAAEFDRVAAAFEARACLQAGQTQSDTRAVIAILLRKRSEVLANSRAGYFIQEWRELSDQVRRLIANDPGYRAIQANRIRNSFEK